MKRGYLLIAFLLMSLLVLAGCGSSSSSSTAPTVKTGKLSVSATFPQGGQPGQIGAAYIDTSTARIKVSLLYGTTERTLDLTRTSPSGSFSGIPVGKAYVLINSFDSTGKVLDQLKIGGEIAEGTNSLTASLIRGRWTLASPITFNKTMSSDTAQVSSFTPVAAAVAFNSYTSFAYLKDPQTQPYLDNMFGYNSYAALVRGFNFYTSTCRPPMGLTGPISGWNSSQMCGGSVLYTHSFKGSANTNSLNGDILALKPDTQYPVPQSDRTNRHAMFFGFGSYSSPENGYTTFNDASVKGYATTRLTNATTIAGNIVEAVTKSRTVTNSCTDSNNKPITCPGAPVTAPPPVTAQSVGKADALRKAIFESSMGIGAAAIGADGCYRGLTVTNTYQYQNYYFDNSTPPQMIQYTVNESDVETVDACVTAFSATGAQVPQADLDIANSIYQFF